MNILILGAGLQGVPTAWALVLLQHDIVLADVSQDALDKAKITLTTTIPTLRILGKPKWGPVEEPQEPQESTSNTINFLLLDKNGMNKMDPLYGVDAVVSCMPYHQNLAWATKCIERRLPYFDLGGAVPVSAAINKLAKERESMVMTDNGLAPGLINFIATHGILQVEKLDKPHTVRMFCGGLPQIPGGKLGYKCTWSYDGLYNEYVDDCKLVKNYQTFTEEGMNLVEDVVVLAGNYEAATTSGAMSHTLEFMKSKGIKTGYYKTLRYPGHWEMIKWLIQDLDMSKEDLKLILKKDAEFSSDKDVVVVRVDVEGKNINFKKEFKILPQDGFSAMQVSTGYSLASVVDIVLRDDVNPTKGDGIDCHPYTYDMIDFKEIEQNLERLGVTL